MRYTNGDRISCRFSNSEQPAGVGIYVFGVSLRYGGQHTSQQNKSQSDMNNCMSTCCRNLPFTNLTLLSWFNGPTTTIRVRPALWDNRGQRKK